MIVLGVLTVVSIAASLLFLPAGRLDLVWFWAWLGVFAGSGTATNVLLSRFQPALLAERLRPPSDRDAATRKVAVPLLAAHLGLAGLDVGRLGWSSMPILLQLVGLCTFAAGFVLVVWTLLSNPFASSAVRIQTERAQTVISSGPYGLVRHPMYLAVVFVCLGSGPALGSWLAAPVLWPVILVFVRRTLIEDRMLHDELAGYAAYAGTVRWRVIPGVF
ncbi:MAG: isoprenylcysteine carboxylmethyltransferase family protein [Myxococcota bacterium]